MKNFFSFSFAFIGTSCIALASIPFGIGSAKAQEAKTTEGTAADLDVMEVNLKDAVKFNWGFQGALQGAGTPNQAGVGAFFPLHIGNNSVTYVDVLANANFSDYNGLSSIGSTKVAGTTISTSTRLGYRWLNKNRSWMFGVNAGYDSRPMATGATVDDDAITDSQTPFFQQIALNLEAKSDKFSVSAYGLVPIGQYGAGSGNIAVINNNYVADNLSTYGLDIGYKISPSIQLALGGYYQLDEKDQHYELSGAQSFGLKTGLTYDVTNELQAGVIYSYDENFESRITGNLKWRFGSGSKNKKTESLLAANPVIQTLSATPENRDVRVANNPCAGVFDNTGGFSGPQLAYARNQRQLNSRVAGSQIAGNLASATLNLIGMGSSIAAQNSQACADFRNSSPGIRGLRFPSPSLSPQEAEDRRRIQQARDSAVVAARHRALLARTHARFRRSFR